MAPKMDEKRGERMELNIRAEARAEAIPLPLVVQSLNVLAMDACALEDRIQTVLLENPLLEAATSHSAGESREYIFASARQSVSLYDELHRQLGCLRIPARLARGAALLIDCLDEDGYLREDLTQLAAEWRLTPAFLEEALRVVQSLEPTGVGCRTLSECLRLQLLELAPENVLALDIVTHHLEELASGTFSLSSYDPEEVEEAIAAIRALSPRPCANCGDQRTEYIVPDIRVWLDENGVLCAELINQPAAPVLSPLYHDYMKAGTGEDRQYIRSQITMARNFLHAMQMRSQTMGLIAQFLITRQSAFFLAGPAAQKSVSLSALAETLDVHVSTVSRAVAGKYVEFRGAVFPLRDLFQGNGAGDLSRAAIIRRIRELLRAEPGLSDSRIAVRLAEQGIQISRRTVNKYRHMG